MTRLPVRTDASLRTTTNARCSFWEWGVIERVSTALLCMKIGLEPIGREMLTAADHIANEPLG